jgi:hypothetical protein
MVNVARSMGNVARSMGNVARSMGNVARSIGNPPQLRVNRRRAARRPIPSLSRPRADNNVADGTSAVVAWNERTRCVCVRARVC